jgi:nicotinamide mononucleotide transporter
LDPLEVAGVLTGVVAVWLTTKENPWCWPIGLVNVLLFSVIFFRAKLYADTGLQIVYAVLCLFGWWSWLRGGKGGSPLRVSRTPLPVAVISFIAGIAVAAVLGFALKHRTDAALPFWDSATASFSLVAQFLQTRKWLENWLVWIAVDVVYVGMYVVKGLHLTAVLYAGFLVLAVIGLRSWSLSIAAGKDVS